MSFTTLGSADFITRSKSFSRSANDALVNSFGNYKFFKKVGNEYIWEESFVATLVAYLAGILSDEDLSMSEHNSITEYKNYILNPTPAQPELDNLIELVG